MKRELNFENFYVYEGNKVAYLAAQKIIEFPGELFNPLYIHGGTGLGKTHLLWALCQEVSKKQPARFFSAKEFEKYLDEAKVVDTVLVVDDLHAISVQYHDSVLGAIETLLTNNKQICFSGNVALRQLKNINPELLSRFEGGLVCDILPPKEMALVEMIKKKSGEAGILLPDEIALELAQISTGSIRAIEGMINRLVAYSSLGNVTLDIESVRMILKEFYPKGIYSPVSSLLEELKKDAHEVLEDVSERVDVREEYREKIYVWEMKGFDTSSLKTLLDGDIELLKQQYADFIKKVERLIALQREFGALDARRFPDEAMKIESMLFSPAHLPDIEELINKIKKSAEEEIDRTFKTYIVGENNKNVFEIYKQQVVPNLGEKFNPFIVYGKEGMGKTRFLEAVKSELAAQGRSVIFFDLASVDDIVKLIAAEEYEILILDNFHNTFAVATGLRTKIFNAVLNAINSGKAVFYSSKTFPTDVSMSDEEKKTFEYGIETELKAPTSDVAEAYVRSHLPSQQAERIISQGMPEFQSFYAIDEFLQSIDEKKSEDITFSIPDKEPQDAAQEGGLISLGLPGEEAMEEEKLPETASAHGGEGVIPLGFSGEEAIEHKDEEVKMPETPQTDKAMETRAPQHEKKKVDLHRFLSQEIKGELIEDNF